MRRMVAGVVTAVAVTAAAVAAVVMEAAAAMVPMTGQTMTWAMITAALSCCPFRDDDC